jgi:SAM-dependent methyltransferase
VDGPPPPEPRAAGSDEAPQATLLHQPHKQLLRDDLDRIYEKRFDDRQRAEKDKVWKEIVAWLQRFVDESRPVLDVATDRGYFIRHVKAAERWATDVRDVREHLGDDVKFVRVSGPAMSGALPQGYFGTVFMSNYLEHLCDSEVVTTQLREARAVLADGGRLIILQPNIRLTGAAYWDFLDHHTALTEKSLVEACELAGFRTRRLIVRFLPFTMTGRLPDAPFLVRAYLRFPPAWWLMGKQTLYIGERV